MNRGKNTQNYFNAEAVSGDHQKKYWEESNICGAVVGFEANLHKIIDACVVSWSSGPKIVFNLDLTIERKKNSYLKL